jgi:alkylation response protein AidB-like acyl-CoA dehydrogenase
MSEPRRSPERAALLASVEGVRPTALAHADASERGRTLARPVVEALRESGLFAMAVPRALGGAECEPITQLEVFEAMARVDTSAGWSLMIGAITTAFAGAYLPAAGRAAIFAARSPICVGLQHPVGVARRAPGGYVLGGRWAFGSGVRHADWVLSGAVIEPGEGAAPTDAPAMLTAAVPVARVLIEDTWDASGLRGSGSDHYRMEGVFVPDDLVYGFPTAPRRCGGPLFSLPLIALLTPAHVGFALGTARRALDEIIDLAPRRQKLWTRLPLGGHAAFHMDLGRAEARLGAARAYAFEVISMMWDRALAAQPLSFSDWAAIRLVTTHVTEVAADVVTFAYRSGGGTALYNSSPLQRCFRDIHAATQHIAATDDAYEFAGRVRLGLAEPHPLLAPREPG